MVHALIDSYKLTDSMDVATAMPATEDELRLFHSVYYLDYLKNNCNDESGIQYTDAADAAANDDHDDCNDSNETNVDDDQLEFGLGMCSTFYNRFFFLYNLHSFIELNRLRLSKVC